MQAFCDHAIIKGTEVHTGANSIVTNIFILLINGELESLNQSV